MTPSSPSAAASSSPAGTPASPPTNTRLPALLVCLVALVLYLPSLRFELVYDDWFLIDPGQNASMVGVNDDFGVALALFGEEYWAGVNPSGVEELKNQGQALYRPLTTFIWGTISYLTKYESPRDAMPYHLVNVLLNVWVVYLLFRIIVRLFGSVRLAVIGSLLYAVHPLHSEAVAYVAGMSDVLSTGAVFLGLLLWLRATSEPGRVKMLPFVGLLVTMYLGMLAKEAAVIVLAVVALTDLTLSLRGRGPAMSQRLVTYGGMLAVLAANLAHRFAVMGYLQPNRSAISALDNVLMHVDGSLRVANSFKILAKYTWLMLWPKDLSVDYSFGAIRLSEGFGSPGPLAGMVLIGTMTIVGLVKLRRSPAFGWGLLLFVGGAVFVSNMIVPIGTIMGERLMYLPSAGLCLAAAVVLDRLVRPAGGTGAMNPVGVLLVVLVVGAAGMRTWVRNHDFRDPLKLFEAAGEVVPDSARVHFQLGTLNFNQQYYNKAVQELEEALRCDPSFVKAAIQLGDVHAADLNWDKAIQTYTNVLQGVKESPADPADLAALQDMVLKKRGEAHRRNGDLEAAATDLERAASLGVAGSGADVQYALLLQGQQRWAESIPVIRNALALDPDDVDLLFALCRAAANTGDKALYDESIAQLKTNDAGRAMALTMEGVTLYAQAMAAQDEAMRSQAMDKFEQALELDDTLATPYAFRGRYMAERSRYLHDAIIEYDRALERDPRHNMALGLKATAQNQLGLYEEALQTIAVLETVNPNPDVLLLKAEAHFGLGELDELEEIRGKLQEADRDPVELIMNTAITYDAQGETARAIELMNQAIADPESAKNPEVWRHLGVFCLHARLYEDAFAAFGQQEAALLANPEYEGPFPYVAINKARALIGLGRDMDAAAELEKAELELAQLGEGHPAWPVVYADVLLTRVDLHLMRDTPLRDVAQAEVLCEEGLQHTGNQHPPFFDRSIEALAVSGELEAARDRARAAQERFFKLDRYPVMVEALGRALAGDRDAAVATLRTADEDGRHDNEHALARLADALEG